MLVVNRGAAARSSTAGLVCGRVPLILLKFSQSLVQFDVHAVHRT